MKDLSAPKRTITKAITWETISTLACFGIAYLMFGNIGICVKFALVCFVLKLFMFYFHERIWHQIPWGHAEYCYNRDAEVELEGILAQEQNG